MTSFRRKSFGLLLLALFVLFLPFIGEVLGGPKVDERFLQIVGFAVTLIALFGGAYFELENIEYNLAEGRKKENRQQRLVTLNIIEAWVNEVSQSFENISILRELSDVDSSDGKLIISGEKIVPLQDTNHLTVPIAKAMRAIDSIRNG